MMFYSPTRGFIHPDLDYPSLPSDMVEITDSEHAALMAGQQSGQVIVAGEGGAPVLTNPAVDLIAYANAKQWALVLGGFSATVSGGQHLFDCDGQAASFMASTVIDLQLPSPPATVNWQLKDGGFVTIAAADFVPLAKALRDFVQATFDALKTVLAGVQADTITTTAEIDAATWPANHD